MYKAIIQKILLVSSAFYFTSCNAADEILFDGEISVEGAESASVLFRRIVDDSLTLNGNVFGSEMLEVFADGQRIYIDVNDYVNRNDVVVQVGDIQILDLSGLANQIIRYERTNKGVGTSREFEKISLSLIGGNSDEYLKLFDIETYSFEVLEMSGSETDVTWQFRLVRREISFLDIDDDGRQDIRVTTFEASADSLTEYPERNNFQGTVTSVTDYLWNGNNFVGN